MVERGTFNLNTIEATFEKSKETLTYQNLNLECKAWQINVLCVELVKSTGILGGFNELLSDLLCYLQLRVALIIFFRRQVENFAWRQGR